MGRELDLRLQDEPNDNNVQEAINEIKSLLQTTQFRTLNELAVFLRSRAQLAELTDRTDKFVKEIKK